MFLIDFVSGYFLELNSDFLFCTSKKVVTDSLGHLFAISTGYCLCMLRHVSPGPGSGVYDHIDDTADVGMGGVGHVGIVGYLGVG